MGGVTGGMTSSLYGGSFMHGFKDGVLSSSYGYMCNHVLHDILRGIYLAIEHGTQASYSAISQSAEFSLNAVGTVSWEVGKTVLFDTASAAAFGYSSKLGTITSVGVKVGSRFFGTSAKVGLAVVGPDLTSFQNKAEQLSLKLQQHAARMR
jgi:hypothetical protein